MTHYHYISALNDALRIIAETADLFYQTNRFSMSGTDRLYPSLVRFQAPYTISLTGALCSGRFNVQALGILLAGLLSGHRLERIPQEDDQYQVFVQDILNRVNNNILLGTTLSCRADLIAVLGTALSPLEQKSAEC